jgi:hypothetical protein
MREKKRVVKFNRAFFTHLRLTILNLELDGDLESLPVAGGLGNVVADLLGRQTQGTHLHTHK